jgi:hypothetical protein
MSVTINASTSSGLVQSADTSGTIELQSNGTTKLTVFSTGVSGTLVQGTAVASTSGTSIDFTSIPSWVKKIIVMFNGVSTNGTSPPMIQLGDSGGVETSGYTGSIANNGSASTSAFSTGFATVSLSSLAALAQSGHIIITNISGNIWVASINLGRTDAAGIYQGAGSKTLSDVLDRIRITTVGGTDTFDAGSINIQYEG